MRNRKAHDVEWKTLEGIEEDIKAAGLAEKGFGEGPVGGYLMQQHPREFAALVYALHGRPIGNYLQVGSAAGGAERFLCEQLGIKNLTIIDMGDHPQFSTWENQNKPALTAQGVAVMEYLGDSHDENTAEFVRLLPRYDLVGIDGDHTPAGVRMDWELITPVLRPGSLVWFHDINHAFMRTRDNGPWEVWSKLKERHHVHLEVMERFGIGLLEIL
jgi:hypothetical protein